MADWAAVANQHLAKGGYKDRIDHRSLKEQGIDRIPQIHVGPAAIRMAEKGLPSDRLDRWKAINKANQVDKEEAEALTATWEKHIAEARQREIEGGGTLLRSLQAQVKQGQEKIKQQESDKALLQECLHAYKHPNDDEQQDKVRGFERE